MTERAWSAYVKCLSLTLKEQSAEIKYVGVFTYPIVTFLTVENRGLPKTKIVSECRKSRDFPQLIFDLNIQPGLLMNRLKQFRERFRFREDI